MTKFKALPRRFDNDYANDGVWFQPEDVNPQIEYPAFKLALLDTSSDRFITAAERLQDQAAKNAPKRGFRQPVKMSQKERDTEAARQFVRNFISICMVDWTVEDEKGKVIPFAPEIAVAYFDPEDQDKRWLLKLCTEFAQNVANYQPDGQTEAPEGN